MRSELITPAPINGRMTNMSKALAKNKLARYVHQNTLKYQIMAEEALITLTASEISIITMALKRLEAPAETPIGQEVANIRHKLDVASDRVFDL